MVQDIFTRSNSELQTKIARVTRQEPNAHESNIDILKTLPIL